MNVSTLTPSTVKCNHTFCLLGGKNKPATYMVTQNWDNGNHSVTYCCENDFQAMSAVLRSTDTVTYL
jgi:hypothetical protein